MNPSTERFLQWCANHPRLQQWGWFVGLWCAGLMAVMLIAYPIKFLIKLAS